MGEGEMAAFREQACLSYWFPKLQAAGVNVPHTEVVTTNAQLWRLLEGQIEDSDLIASGMVMVGKLELIDKLCGAAKRIGGPPWFLRTGHGSGKHDWIDTCFVELVDWGGVDVGEDGELARIRHTIMDHVHALVEWSNCVDMMGLPTKVWAVREFLPLVSSFTSYNGMPVAREFRFFIDGGAITNTSSVCCMHPYWPKAAVHRGGPSEPLWREHYDKLFAWTPELLAELYPIAIQAARQFDGAWSLDLAQHQDGRWFAIDMAPAALSWHWPGCDNEKRWKVRE
jgi:hypothetical protein